MTPHIPIRQMVEGRPTLDRTQTCISGALTFSGRHLDQCDQGFWLIHPSASGTRPFCDGQVLWPWAHRDTGTKSLWRGRRPLYTGTRTWLGSSLFQDEVPVLRDEVPHSGTRSLHSGMKSPCSGTKSLWTMDHGQRTWPCHGRAPRCGLRCADVSLGSPKVSELTGGIPSHRRLAGLPGR